MSNAVKLGIVGLGAIGNVQAEAFRATGEEGVTLLKIFDAVYASGRTGRKMTVR